MRIPEPIMVGNIPVEIVDADKEWLDEQMGGDIEGMYSPDHKVIWISSDLEGVVREEVIFHELGHAIEDIIFSSEVDLDELEINVLGIAISQITRQIVKENV